MPNQKKERQSANRQNMQTRRSLLEIVICIFFYMYCVLENYVIRLKSNLLLKQTFTHFSIINPVRASKITNLLMQIKNSDRNVICLKMPGDISCETINLFPHLITFPDKSCFTWNQLIHFKKVATC